MYKSYIPIDQNISNLQTYNPQLFPRCDVLAFSTSSVPTFGKSNFHNQRPVLPWN